MHLRSLIQGSRAPAKLDDQIRSSSPRTAAIVAIPAILRPPIGPTIATIATIAALGSPETWPDRLRSLAPAAGIRWDPAADALDMLLISGVVEKALGLGWDARELVGVCRAPPHDSPSRAGLIWSVKPGDTVPDVRRSGCIIAYRNVRHIWKRTPLPADGSICLPWELRS